MAERMIRYGRKDTDVSRKQVLNYLNEREMAWKVYDVLAPRYKWRNGGFTRIVKTTRRLGDGKQKAYLEFVDRDGELRPASECNEDTWEAEKRTEADTYQMFQDWRKAQDERLDNWKTASVMNPYRFDKEGNPLK